MSSDVSSGQREPSVPRTNTEKLQENRDRLRAIEASIRESEKLVRSRLRRLARLH